MEHLIRSLSGTFYPHFATDLAARIRAEDRFGVLYEAATAPLERFTPALRHKIRFRAAYVLETLFMDDPRLLQPFAAVFCAKDFSACTDPSARRHFAKIMAHLLLTYTPPQAALERIAETAAEWALAPGTKVAVKVWAVEVLKICRDRVGWVAETWDDLLEALAREATPGIACRLRKSWKKRESLP